MASSGAEPPAGRSRVFERDMDCDAAAGFFQGAGENDLGPQTGVTPEVSFFVVGIIRIANRVVRFILCLGYSRPYFFLLEIGAEDNSNLFLVCLFLSRAIFYEGNRGAAKSPSRDRDQQP